ncbi:MAG: CPBP family intramembrane metalloprotease [Acidobacteriaceae bacterium]|nr:CPBP family intramembrane metalloprotease [Acidobacteriaceae bacterium]
MPYMLYAAGTGDWRSASLARLLAVAVPVLGIYTFFPLKALSRFTLQDAAVALLLIIAVLSHVLARIWNIPVNLDFIARLYLLTVACWCWTTVRPVPTLGYSFTLTARVFRAATWNFLCFAVIALPTGFVLGFTAWHPRWRGAGTFFTDFLEIFLFIALLEETFFRGFLQSLLSASLNSWWKAQAIVSCLFGLFHILHAPFPNWRYVLLATAAGWFYGSAFRNGGSLLASSLTHALVDTVWRTFLTR